jgi:sugar lactone lactonase YvrE
MRSDTISTRFSKIEALESRTLFSTSFLSHLTATPTVVGNTIPGNGDVNPYGVAFVTKDAAGGKLVNGDILVSNFNTATGGQGTGSTIVEIDPNTGNQTLFFQGSAGLGLTTALGVLPGGYVLVGSLPANSQGAAQGPGALLIIDRSGKEIASLSDAKLLNGPWDLTVDNDGFFQHVFVSNALGGNVTRLDFFDNLFGDGDKDDLFLFAKTQVASGYEHNLDPTAFAIGPTGLAFDDSTDTLYVASTGDNAIFAVHNAEDSFFSHSGTGTMIFSDTHLRGPLGLAFATNGDLLAANGDAFNSDPTQNSEIVEFTKTGTFVDQFQINPTLGSAFGLAVGSVGGKTVFAAVDDTNNQLDIWTF